ncbi:MAG: PIG-L family deacetylase [Gemmatimonadota bacterium]|nr:PIG-L family deacetylase [Gemmatimonadota bacterium]
MRHFTRALCVLATLAGATSLSAQTIPAAPKTILAIGAHAGDMELTAGLVLAKQRQLGDRVVFLHLTLGERGHPTLGSSAYADQKRREAQAAAKAIGAEAMFGPYRDGELPNDAATRQYVADVIRRVRPSLIITHWRESLHRDHATTHTVVADAVLLAAIDTGKGGVPRHRGARLWYAENWEDKEGFQPYLYVDVSGHMPAWTEMVKSYEFVRGEIASFEYLDYYTALATVRGAEARRAQAVAFDIDPFGKRRVLDAVP